MKSPFLLNFFLLSGVSHLADSILVGAGSDKPSPSLTNQQVINIISSALVQQCH